MSDRDWAALFRQTFAAPVSPIEARIGRAVFGDEYPEELDPHSFVTRSELRRFAEELHVGVDDTLVDLGCGRGGPGLWVAAQTGAGLVAVDIADSAVEATRARALDLGMADRVVGRVGTFEATTLADASAEAIMSIDALLFTPDKARALTEVARVLRLGGRFVFTSWDYQSQPAGRPPQVSDHQPLLKAAGFHVQTYEETDDWRHRLTRHDELLLEAVDEIAAETGDSAAELRQEIAEEAATIKAMTRRVFAVAERV
jgi:cyclopropane fatty-acyl-phospholipid synthase-like methyltransferase